MKKALLVIDCQNEYYAAGGFPLWNMDGTVTNIKAAMKKAKEKGIPIILAQHVFPKDSGMPAFIDGTPGDDIADEILAIAPDALIVRKANADVFLGAASDGTTFEEILTKLGVDEIIITGMMTHNCVCFTALSKHAQKYTVKIIPEAVTTVSEIIHGLSLMGLADAGIPMVTLDDAL